MNRKSLIVFSLILAAGQMVADEKDVAALGFKKKSAQASSQTMQEGMMQGDPLDNQYPAAYNAPAATDVCHKMGMQEWPFNWSFDVSFLYWYGSEDGLSLASDGILNGDLIYFATNTKTHYQSFMYRPGFKLGFGIVGDHEWSLNAEYTWLRGHSTTHVQAPSDSNIAGATTLSGTPVLLVEDWFVMGQTLMAQALAASSIASSWDYGLDIVDLTTSRPYYQGRTVTVTPFGGLRAAFIRQNLHLALIEAPGLFTGGALTAGTSPSQPIVSHNVSHSWAVGPRVGSDVYGLLPLGFRLEGDFAASLLYTKYTKVKHSEDAASTAYLPGPYTLKRGRFSALRPMLEVGLGFGWGEYIYCKDYHIDFSARYDFNLMWSQNVIRQLLDDTLVGTGYGPSDLYFHGMTLQARFDF